MWDQEERHMVPEVFCPCAEAAHSHICAPGDAIHTPTDVPSCCWMEIHGPPLICLRWICFPPRTLIEPQISSPTPKPATGECFLASLAPLWRQQHQHHLGTWQRCRFPVLPKISLLRGRDSSLLYPALFLSKIPKQAKIPESWMKTSGSQPVGWDLCRGRISDIYSVIHYNSKLTVMK